MLSHLLDDSDSFVKKPAPRSFVITLGLMLHPGSFPGNAQILSLTGSTESYDVNRLDFRPVDFRHISQMLHPVITSLFLSISCAVSNLIPASSHIVRMRSGTETRFSVISSDNLFTSSQ